MERKGDGDQREEFERGLALEGTGITLLGVLLGIAVSVGFGVPGPWWVQVGAGVATIVLLVLIVGLLGRRTRALKHLAHWLIRQGK